MIIAIILVFFILIAILVYAIILGGSICSREDEEKEIEYLKRMENEKNGKYKNR